MGKSIPDANLDAQLEVCEGSTLHVCDSEPANYAGIAAAELASGTIVGSNTKANGDTSGRKSTRPAQSAYAIDASGDSTHVVESNGIDAIKLITTCTTQSLVSGGTVNLSLFAHEIQDPS